MVHCSDEKWIKDNLLRLAAEHKKNCWKDSDGCNTICCDNYNYSCTTTLLLCVPDEVVKSWGGVVK
jgi:hypothetical protein